MRRAREKYSQSGELKVGLQLSRVCALIELECFVLWSTRFFFAIY